MNDMSKEIFYLYKCPLDSCLALHNCEISECLHNELVETHPCEQCGPEYVFASEHQLEEHQRQHSKYNLTVDNYKIVLMDLHRFYNHESDDEDSDDDLWDLYKDEATIETLFMNDIILECYLQYFERDD